VAWGEGRQLLWRSYLWPRMWTKRGPLAMQLHGDVAQSVFLVAPTLTQYAQQSEPQTHCRDASCEPWGHFVQLDQDGGQGSSCAAGSGGRSVSVLSCANVGPASSTVCPSDSVQGRFVQLAKRVGQGFVLCSWLRMWVRGSLCAAGQGCGSGVRFVQLAKGVGQGFALCRRPRMWVRGSLCAAGGQLHKGCGPHNALAYAELPLGWSCLASATLVLGRGPQCNSITQGGCTCQWRCGPWSYTLSRVSRCALTPHVRLLPVAGPGGM
jgi:hypothetical protein